jgi:hypothetical protein
MSGSARDYARPSDAQEHAVLYNMACSCGSANVCADIALRLPAGAYRMSGSPREYACPSDAEEHAALYNMACCYAQLGQKAAALTCLESILETGGRGLQPAACQKLDGKDCQQLRKKLAALTCLEAILDTSVHVCGGGWGTCGRLELQLLVGGQAYTAAARGVLAAAGVGA